MSIRRVIFPSPINYSQGWEDHKVIEEGLKVNKGDVLACVLASGDNVLNLLLFEPSKIFAFDISKTQIYEVKLKINCIKYLNYNEFITLLGYAGEKTERLKIFDSISNYLDEDTYKFWHHHIKIIKKGLAFQGHWEKYIKTLKIPLKLFIGKDYQRYVESESITERNEIFEKHINRPAFHFLSKIIFNKFIVNMNNYKIRYVQNLPDSFDFYKSSWDSVKNVLVNIQCKNNQYHYWILSGKMPDDRKYWQPYLQEQNYEKLRRNIDKISIINKDFLNGLKTFDSNSINGFYLSDIFDWMNFSSMEKNLQEIIRVAKDKAKIIIFVLNYKKTLPEVVINNVKYDEEVSKKLQGMERVGLYPKIFLLEVNK